MEKLKFTTSIKADKKKVWDMMLQPATYMIWTTPFYPGSRYEGSLEKGSKIKFVGPDGSGMLSEVAESKPLEFISFRHYGEVKADGVEDTTSESVKAWAPSLENYTFTEKDGVTELTIEMETSPDFAKMFEGMWPKALEILKDICERKTLITVEAVVNADLDKTWKFWSDRNTSNNGLLHLTIGKLQKQKMT